MKSVEIPITLDGSGAADLQSPLPVSGRIAEIRCTGTGLNEGGAADYTITRKQDAAQVLKKTNADAPWSACPSQPVVDNEGAAALFAAGGTALRAGIPVDGYLRIQVAQGKANGKGAIVVYVDD